MHFCEMSHYPSETSEDFLAHSLLKCHGTFRTSP